ncbi:glucose-1-phosphate adenylyltransferase [Gemmatimonadetes bacterium T265]|nr:glucose-1-phosphate adenylyltransferase [Gemmatimonadetes bacterium T265]
MLNAARMQRPKVLALVLAGGAGSRLGPLTARRAKPALPFAGVYRLVDFALTNCVHSGLGDVWVVEQYQPHAINDHLLNGRPWDLDRNVGGLRILPPFTGARGEGFAAGNADVLWRSRDLLREFAPDQLVVMSADHVERVDLREVLDAHRDASARVTLVTTEVAAEDAHRFGIVAVDGGGRVTAFDSKPERPRGTTAATEVFVYDAPHLLATLDRLHADVVRDAGGDDAAHLGDFGDHLLPALVAEGGARAFPHAGYWRDVGTVESYWRGHMDLLGERPALVLDDPAWPVRTAAAARMPARVARTAAVDDALLSPGAAVAGRVERSVLGPGVVVEAGAEVRESVLLDGAVVRRGARVTRAVVDLGAVVAAGAVVGRGSGEPAVVGAGE